MIREITIARKKRNSMTKLNVIYAAKSTDEDGAHYCCEDNSDD